MSKTQEEIKALTTKLAETTGTRYCSHCAHYQPTLGGKWISIQNGLRRRWKCARCVENAHKK